MTMLISGKGHSIHQAAAVTAYGGEKLSPPEYGKVYIAVRSKSGVNLNTTTKKRIQNQLLDYSMASIQPVIVVDPRIYISRRFILRSMETRQPVLKRVGMLRFLNLLTNLIVKIVMIALVVV